MSILDSINIWQSISIILFCFCAILLHFVIVFFYEHTKNRKNVIYQFNQIGELLTSISNLIEQINKNHNTIGYELQKYDDDVGKIIDLFDSKIQQSNENFIETNKNIKDLKQLIFAVLQNKNFTEFIDLTEHNDHTLDTFPSQKEKTYTLDEAKSILIEEIKTRKNKKKRNIDGLSK